MRSIQRFKLAIGATAITLLIPALFVVYADPFQVFHKSYIPFMGLHHNQRFQNAGLINSHLADPAEGYDSIMVGTSLSENFTTPIAAKALGWKKPLRLFFGGGDSFEQSSALKHAMNTRRVKHVLWEISPAHYATTDIWLRGANGSPHTAAAVDRRPFPVYLYNENPFDNVKYIFNFDILTLSWKYAHRPRRNQWIFPFTMDNLGYWEGLSEKSHTQFNSPENIKSLIDREPIDLAGHMKSIDANTFIYPALNENAFPIMDKWCNTDVEFVLFIAPLSKVKYTDTADATYRAITMTRAILKKIEHCSNIRLHAFDAMSFTGDMNNYKDPIHYGGHISNKMLELIGKHQNIITLKNVDVYEDEFIRGIDSYNVYSSYPQKPAI